MKKKLTENDFPKLRDHFLNVFIKGTYKKKSYHERRGMTQPEVRSRFLAEDGYNGQYQPKSFHKATEDHRYDFMVIGRYYTMNFSYSHYRLRVINLEKGTIGFVSV